ncbi:MAG: ShlB/FhaC/HecB family hemolysin secretion/activation protein [Sedimentisphaerales bacterium]|nr:ShlB/FhaC/HecB family hemolysin secretion/activation protein [Sedimentisphaerales bacterium]
MTINQTKTLIVFLFVGLAVSLVRSEQLSSDSSSAEQEVNVTQGMEDEATQETVLEGEVTLQQLNLPEDQTPRFKVREIRISGNNLLTTKELFERMPQIFNASNKPLLAAESQHLYDFRVLHDVISDPNQPQEVSSRTIQGLTLYILSVYRSRHYAGIYVFVPRGTVTEGMELVGGVLPIKVIEAPIYEVDVKYYGADQNEVPSGRLRRSALNEWSPVKAGRVANQKSLDHFVNLLNLNPDRHVSVLVSKGTEPNTLKVQYDIYEADPWHYFIQVDNSGTNDRQWSPRAGVINTNLLGIDDRLTTVYQAKPDSTIDDNYSIYGSYDFPIYGPKLRLNIYGGHSEFDINPEGGTFNFLGRGTFYGALLRYNVYQYKGWFFDVTGSISHERSKVTPSLFPSAGSDVDMDLFGVGVNLRHSDDMSNSSLTLDRTQSMSGSSRSRFELARTQADPDFSIYTLSANHSRYMDKEKYGQLRTVARWIKSDERLIPAKMTSFGGMYTVRGYDEYEIVADGGMLASIQYEFDWLKYNRAVAEEEAGEEQPQTEQYNNDNLDLTRLSPLVFMDFGRSNIEDAVAGEDEHETLWSVGVGTNIGLGKNLSGACYYGYPLRETDGTRRGKGRLSVSFMLRW